MAGRPDQVKTIIKIKVTPRSSRNEILGMEGDAYRVKLTSPPVDGKANEALRGFLSKKLGISKSLVGIVSGERARVKLVEVVGLAPSDVQSRLSGG